MQRQLSSVDFAELWAEEQLSPRGQARADQRAAIIALVVAKALGGAKSAKLEDFLAHREPGSRRRQTATDMAALAAGFAAASRGGFVGQIGAGLAGGLRVMNPQVG